MSRYAGLAFLEKGFVSSFSIVGRYRDTLVYIDPRTL